MSEREKFERVYIAAGLGVIFVFLDVWLDLVLGPLDGDGEEE